MRYGIVLLAAIWGLTISGAAADRQPPDPESHNRLTSEERAAGWRLLFDGEDTGAWTSMDGAGLPAQTWTVEDGAIRTLPDGSGGDLRTIDEFSDFELKFEWKIPPGGNSGVKYLAQEEWIAVVFRPDMPESRKRRVRLSAVGPEYQIFDDSRLKQNRPDWATSGAGALYLLYAPQNKRLHPPGEWNSSRIVVDGLRAEHWLNGSKVVEYEFNSEDLLGRVKKTKFRHMPGYGIKGPGPIVLQHHGHPAWFRNIKVRELSK